MTTPPDHAVARRLRREAALLGVNAGDGLARCHERVSDAARVLLLAQDPGAVSWARERLADELARLDEAAAAYVTAARRALGG